MTLSEAADDSGGSDTTHGQQPHRASHCQSFISLINSPFGCWLAVCRLAERRESSFVHRPQRLGELALHTTSSQIITYIHIPFLLRLCCCCCCLRLVGGRSCSSAVAESAIAESVVQQPRTTSAIQVSKLCNFDTPNLKTFAISTLSTSQLGKARQL